MTTADERRGALDAVERIVNRGENVVEETLHVLARLYVDVSIRDGRIVVDAADPDDEALLARIAWLISAHTARRP